MLRSGFKVAPVGLGYSSVSMIETLYAVFQDDDVAALIINGYLRLHAKRRAMTPEDGRGPDLVNCNSDREPTIGSEGRSSGSSATNCNARAATLIYSRRTPRTITKATRVASWPAVPFLRTCSVPVGVT